MIMHAQKQSFTKACSVNTLYFWEKPEYTVKKVMNALQPGGKFVLAFEDIHQLEHRKLDTDVFRLYTDSDVCLLLKNSGFSKNVCAESRARQNLRFHCAVATK